MDKAQGPIAPTYQWNILRMMAIIAGLAPLLALTRYPFAFGLLTFGGSIAVFGAAPSVLWPAAPVLWPYSGPSYCP
jgi:hypothetical protein